MTTQTQTLFAQVRTDIVRPVLAMLPFKDAVGGPAENLVLGTAANESGMQYLQQYPMGPALSPWQMEPATHDDIWANYVAFHPEIATVLNSLVMPGLSKLAQLSGNLFYACAMVRLVYRRAPPALPAANDLPGMGAYYKQFYNTGLGAATVGGFVDNYNLHIGVVP